MQKTSVQPRQGRGLGKGLSALISENYVQPAAEKPPSPLMDLEHRLLVPGKYQPRSHFSEESMVELADSILRNGIMQPIVARLSTEHPGKYEIVAGERRWRAAHRAGLTVVPVLLRDMADKQALEVALIENVQRQDLSPLEEANGYQRLLEEFNYTQEELGQAVGKSRSHVANLLRLIALPDEVKEMLDSGALSMGHARALLTSSDAVGLARQIVENGMNVREAEAFRHTKEGTAKQKRARNRNENDNKNSDVLALEETLSRALGLNVRINDNGQQGEIVITYESLNQLDEVLRKLGGSI